MFFCELTIEVKFWKSSLQFSGFIVISQMQNIKFSKNRICYVRDMKPKFKNALFVIFSIWLLKLGLESKVIPKSTNE